jgi:hypothetical protein
VRHWKRLATAQISKLNSKRNSSNQLKGAWTHFPTADCLGFSLERLRAIAMLIDTARRKYASAYKLLSRTSSLGPFLGMILTLCAIVARLDMLLVDLRAALAAAWSAVHPAYCLLTLFGTTKEVLLTAVFPPDPTNGPLLPPSPVVTNNLVEDLGEAISQGATEWNLDTIMPLDLMPPFASNPNLDDLESLQYQSLGPSVDPATKTPLTPDPHKHSAVEQSLRTVKRKKEKRREKKVVKDEIDAIFG